MNKRKGKQIRLLFLSFTYLSTLILGKQQNGPLLVRWISNNNNNNNERPLQWKHTAVGAIYRMVHLKRNCN